MDRFFDMESAPCEHVLVKTMKWTHKCSKCRQFKWPWSKAVGCIKCKNIWHRRCWSVEREVDDREIEPCTDEFTAVVSTEEEYSNSVVGIAKTVGKFLKHPWRRIRRKVDRSRTAGVALKLSGQPLLATSSGSWPSIVHPVTSPEAENESGKPKRAITLDARPLNVCPTVVSEAENGQFSYHYNCQWSYRKVTFTWTADNAMELFRHLLPAVTVDSWLLPIVFQKAILPTIITTVAAAQINISKVPLAITWKPLVIQDNDVVQVDIKREKVEKSIVTTDLINGQFFYHYNCQRSYRKVTVTWTADSATELFRELLPVVTVDSWPLPIVFQKTIRPTIITTTATVGTALMNIFKAPLAITKKPLSILPLAIARKPLTMIPLATVTVPLTITTTPPAITAPTPTIPTTPSTVTAASPDMTAALSNITAAAPVITTETPTITAVLVASPKSSRCNRPNCKNRRCRRRQTKAANNI